LAHRINTCKIAFQVIIATFLAMELVICMILKPIEIFDNVFGQDSCLFNLFVDLTYLGFLLILYKLGTTKMKGRERSEASTRASTRFTVNDESE
jgi:hypothetical protein